MTTELLVAPPATGKTQACIKRIQELRANEPLASVWVVVPDRLQASAFRRRVADCEGAIGTYVGTFGDLYKYILEHSQMHVPVASSPLLHRLIQEVVDIAVEQGGLTHFSPLQRMPGFILALRESFAELKRSLIYPDQFIEFTQSGTTAQQELALLYSLYQTRLRDLNWADPEGISWLAVEALKGHPHVASLIKLLVVDGFDSLNGTQHQAIKLLSTQVSEILITFPGIIGSKRPAHRRFLEDLDKLIQKLSPHHISLNNPPFLPADLLHIEQNLFESSGSVTQPTIKPILLEARSPADETREALRWIKRLVIREGIPLSSCMIFTPNPTVYHPQLKACAEEFGIPIRFTQDEPLSESPAITALLNLLALPSKNFNTRALVNVLRCPYFDLSISSDIADQLELVSRVAQIVEGRDQWQETWDRLAPHSFEVQSDVDDERILPGLPRGAKATQLRQIMEALFNRITPPDHRCTQTEWITWLEDLLDQLQFYQNATTERDQNACEVFRETLRALVLSEVVAGERVVDYAQFFIDLQGTLEGIGQREPNVSGKPALLVGRMVEARGLRFQAVALLGLSEGLFPANEHPDPFLEEPLRAALGLDQRLQREQAGLFYQAVTRSDRHLLITRPYLSEDGEKWEESTFWKAVQRLFSKEAVETVRPDDPQPLVEAASTQELLFTAVRRQSLPQRYDFLHERWNGLRHAREVVKARRAKHPKGPHEGYVEAIAPFMEKRYSSEHTWSPSRLEYYGTCPYQFYIRTALGLEARAVPQLGLEPGQLGSMLHKILEDTYRNASDPKDIAAVLSSLEIIAGQVFSDAPRQFGFRPSTLWENEKAELLDKLRQTIQALVAETDWTPIEFEMEFGKGDYPPLIIDLGSEVLRIRGVVDRVDRNSSGQLRVIDYKSGSTHLTANDLKDGHRLQLPIYALAVRDARKLGIPVEGIYWKILGAEAGSLKLSKFKTDTNQGVDAAIEVMMAHLVRIVNGIRSAEFPSKTPRVGCPSYCPGAQWCWRFEPEY